MTLTLPLLPVTPSGPDPRPRGQANRSYGDDTPVDVRLRRDLHTRWHKNTIQRDLMDQGSYRGFTATTTPPQNGAKRSLVSPLGRCKASSRPLRRDARTAERCKATARRPLGCRASTLRHEERTVDHGGSVEGGVAAAVQIGSGRGVEGGVAAAARSIARLAAR